MDGDLWRKMQPRMLCTANYPHVDVIKCGCSFCPVLEYVILHGDSLLPSGHCWPLDCARIAQEPAGARLHWGRSGSVLSFQCSYQRIYLPPTMTIGPQRQAPTFLVCCLRVQTCLFPSLAPDCYQPPTGGTVWSHEPGFHGTVCAMMTLSSHVCCKIYLAVWSYA